MKFSTMKRIIKIIEENKLPILEEYKKIVSEVEVGIKKFAANNVGYLITNIKMEHGNYDYYISGLEIKITNKYKPHYKKTLFFQHSKTIRTDVTYDYKHHGWSRLKTSSFHYYSWMNKNMI